MLYTFTKLHDRCILNVGNGVRVGVGPMEFHLYDNDSRFKAKVQTQSWNAV